MGYPKRGRESQKNLKWTFENWGARVERDRIKKAAEGEFRARPRPPLALNTASWPCGDSIGFRKGEEGVPRLREGVGVLVEPRLWPTAESDLLGA